MASPSKWFKNIIIRKDAGQEIVQHLIQRDKKERELDHDIKRYLIHQDRQEKLYQKILSLIFLIASLILFFSSDDPWIKSISILFILISVINEYCRRKSKSHLDERLFSNESNIYPDEKKFDEQLKNLYQLTQNSDTDRGRLKGAKITTDIQKNRTGGHFDWTFGIGFGIQKEDRAETVTEDDVEVEQAQQPEPKIDAAGQPSSEADTKKTPADTEAKDSEALPEKMPADTEAKGGGAVSEKMLADMKTESESKKERGVM